MNEDSVKLLENQFKFLYNVIISTVYSRNSSFFML